MLILKNPRLRKALRILLPAAVIPAAVAAGAAFAGERRHMAVSLTVACLSVLLFIAGIERRQIGTRRAVLVSVMTALAVAGRMIPILKPVTAMAVMTGVYLGGEAGFLVGALSALLSNFYFGQGPWTPFQMLAFGLTGLFAGLLCRPLAARRWVLCLYGFFAAVLYSAVMDVWTVVWYNGMFSFPLYLTAAVTALPHTAAYAAGNCVFLFLMAKPFGRKLRRVKVRYGV